MKTNNNHLIILLIVAIAQAIGGSPNEPSSPQISDREASRETQNHHGPNPAAIKPTTIAATATQHSGRQLPTLTNAQQGPQPQTQAPPTLVTASSAVELNTYLARDFADSIHNREDRVHPVNPTARHSVLNNHRSSAAPNNHQNYPPEPYPSASYTSLVTVPPNNSSSTSQHALHAASSFLNREHHQLNGIVPTGNQAPAPSSQQQHQQHQPSQGRFFASGDTLGGFDSASNASNLNHTIDQYTTMDLNFNPYKPINSLNTNLIQDLTASLFPIKQLSNGTLLSLSELLNKTRNNQPANHKQHYYLGTSSEQNPSSHPVGSSSINTFAPMQTPTTPSYLNAAFSAADPHQYTASSVFEFMKPSGSQVFQRGQKSPARYQPAYFGPSNSIPAHKPAASSSLRFASQYNSPFSLQSASQISPLVGGQQYFSESNSLRPTFAQSFGQQASSQSFYRPQTTTYSDSALYNAHDSFFDGLSGLSGLKQPQVQPLHMISNGLKNFLTEHQQQQKQGSAFQYVQQHNANNQNHIDKIVYHSTPFRPSIANPPTNQSNNNQQVGGAARTSDGSSGNGLLSHEDKSALVGAASIKPADNQDDHSKAMAFASFGSPSSAAVLNAGSDNANNSSSRYDAGNSIRGQSDNQTAFPSPFDEIEFDRFQTQIGLNQAPGSQQSNSSKSSSSLGPISSSNRDHEYQATDGGSGTAATLPTNQNKSSQPTAAPPGPAILFDLYEREVDNQIREALYGGSGAQLLNSMLNHQMSSSRQPPAPQLSVPPLSTWFEKTPSAAASIFSEQHLPLPESQGQASWQRPVALGAPVSAASYLHHNSARPLQSQPSIDHLAAALQELPTFAAADLQPIYPGSAANPSYSLLPPAPENYQDTAASSQQQQLASLLASMNNQGDDSPSSDLWSPTGKKYSPTATHHQQASSLPSLFLKLNSNPLSTILASPLAHLYASLPGSKTRQKKPVSHQASSSAPATSYFTSSSSGSASSFLPLQTFASLSGKQLLNALSGGSEALMASMSKNSFRQKHLSSADSGKSIRNPIYRQLYHNQQHNQQQRNLQQAAIAAATANLLAAAAAATNDVAGPQTLQAALVHHQNLVGSHPSSTSIIQHSGGDEPILATSSSLIEHHHSNGGDIKNNNKVMGGLGGGGISPFFWRNFLSPANWARKQSISSSSATVVTTPPSSQNNHHSAGAAIHHNNYGSHQQQQQNNDLSHQSSNTNAATAKHLSLNSLFGGGFFGPLASDSANAPISTTSSAPSATSNKYQKPNKAPTRVEIKILKIPVAFYDHQPASPLPRAIGLLPAASSLTSSLLSSIPCPLNHGPSSPGAYGQGPHTLASHTSIDQRHSQLSKPMPVSQRQPVEISSIIPHLSLTGTSFISHPLLSTTRYHPITSLSPAATNVLPVVAPPAPSAGSLAHTSAQRLQVATTSGPVQARDQSQLTTYSPPVAAYLDSAHATLADINSLVTQDHLQLPNNDQQHVLPMEDVFHR